jgi:hypothetical protein
MDVPFIRDLLIIILYSLLTIVIIGGSIAGYIFYRRFSKRVKDTVDTVERPIRTAEKIFAYARGGGKGILEAIGIMTGRNEKHEHQQHEK